MHLCAGRTATSWIFEPFGEIGANFSLQLSSRTQIAKIENKKVIAENQCEKHKKSSLVLCVKLYLFLIYQCIQENECLLNSCPFNIRIPIKEEKKTITSLL